MTDRINALIVVLDRDTRDDDAAPTIAAIQQIKGVLSVAANVVDMDDYIAATRASTALRKLILDVLNPPDAGERGT